MSTVTFILKDPQAKEETPIFLVMWIDQKRIKISTGKKIHPKNWFAKEHRARQTEKYKNFKDTNERLTDIKEKALACYDKHMMNNDILYPTRLKEELELAIRPKPQDEPEKMTFYKAGDQYIKTINRKAWTIKHYNTTLNVLDDYQKHKNVVLDFCDITMDFYDSFIQYCNKEKVLAFNTTGTHIKNIKIFYKYALRKEYCSKELPKDFKVFAETADTIYLNEQELQTIYDLDLSKEKRLEQQRDLFIIGCYTGLRFGDLSKLTMDNVIKGGTRIRIKTEKTGETVEIPVHWTIRAILDKYAGNLPRAISDQKMNAYLKEIAQKEEAKLNEYITKRQNKGGMEVETRFQKWQLVTVHTARRSFATNAYLAKVPSISISKITGHKSEKSFLKYIKISQEENADLMADHPFFNKSPLKVVNE
jgi:integrase